MDSFDFGFDSKEFLVSVYGYFKNFGVSVGLPSRVSFADIYMSSGQFKYGFDGVCHVLAGRQDGASLAAGDGNFVIVYFYGCQVGRYLMPFLLNHFPLEAVILYSGPKICLSAILPKRTIIFGLINRT